MGKVWKWSNLVLVKVVVFFIKFDKNFVWTKYFFHTYGFLSLEGPLLAGLCSREPSPVSRACSKVKKPYVWKKYFVQTNFLSNLVKKSTTLINTKLLQFHTLPTLVFSLVITITWSYFQSNNRDKNIYLLHLHPCNINRHKYQGQFGEM